LNGEVKVYPALLLGVLLISLALSPIEARIAVFLEWAGAFLAFMALTYAFQPRTAIMMNMIAFLTGSIVDSWLLGMNPLGWVLTNYMLFLHAFLGSSIGLLLKHGSSSPSPPQNDRANYGDDYDGSSSGIGGIGRRWRSRYSEDSLKPIDTHTVGSRIRSANIEDDNR